MKRNQQHIIEEESIKALKNLIPDSWVINEFTKDYGKDLHIEIFKNYEATGKIFITQVKGSSQEIHNDNISVALKVDTLKYYQELDYPVLLVFYSTRNKSFWAIWANGLLSSIKIKSKQRSVLVTMNKDNRITATFFEQLTQEFHSMIPYVVNVVVNSGSEKGKLVESRIINWLQIYFPLAHRVRQWQYPRKLEITINEVNNELQITFEQSGYLLRLRPISSVENAIWMYKPRVDEKSIHPQEMQIVYELANRFAKSHLTNAMRLFKFVVPYLPEPLPRVSLLQMAIEAVNAGCIHELDELIHACLETESVDQFIYCNNAYFTRKEYHSKYSSNLVKGLEKFQDRPAAAEIAYNLGAYYRHNHHLHEGSTYYHLCRKKNPDYLNRSYWWQEYAGILHLTRHHQFASRFYEKSLQCEDAEGLSIFTKILLADSYFHLAKFDKAAAQLDDHMKMVEKIKKIPSAYTLLLHAACLHLVGKKMTGVVIDEQLSDQLVQQGIDQKDVAFFEKAVEANPVNDLAWFNIGTCYAQQGDFQLAYTAFEMSALLQESDLMTWFMCFISALNNSNATGCLLITQVCMERFGENMVNDFIQFIHDKSDIPKEKMVEVIKYFESTMKTIEEAYLPLMYQPSREIIRIFHE